MRRMRVKKLQARPKTGPKNEQERWKRGGMCLIVDQSLPFVFCRGLVERMLSALFGLYCVNWLDHSPVSDKMDTHYSICSSNCI